MAGLLSYATLITDYLPEAPSDATSQAVRGRALERAERAAAGALGYPGASPTWASATYALRLEELTTEPTMLRVPMLACTLTDVRQDASLVFGASTIVPSSDYETETTTHGLILHLLPLGTTPSWYTGRRQVLVNCSGGYTNEAAIPVDLAGIVYRWTAEWWLKRRVRHLSSTSQGGSSQSYLGGVGDQSLGDMPDDVREALGAWMLWSAMGAA